MRATGADTGNTSGGSPGASGKGVYVGVAYYPEYQPYDRLAADLDLMAEAGFSVIRVGESTWATWEPSDGTFNLDWLQPVLDGARARDIAVIIGTPTYAAPPWLRHKYPETAAWRDASGPVPYGSRQDIDFTHPAFRHLAGRLIRRIVARYASHPAVIGWQLDNEPGFELLHNPGVFAGFIDHLRDSYGDPAVLNDKWGLTYWSHRISGWAELWPPDGNTTPAYDLAWRRYQAALTTEFIRWQAGLVRELARGDQFVTTCMPLDSRKAADEAQLAAAVDVAAANIYYPMQDALALPDRSPGLATAASPVTGPEWLPWFGTWLLYQKADMAYGLRGEPFLVTETTAAGIGGPHVNFPAYDGQWRQAAWALVARGAGLIGYWHWHTLHFGHETYWGGVLGHSLQPDRCYLELSRTARELSQAAGAVAGLAPDAEVGIVISPESKWAMEFQPPLAQAGTNHPDRLAYQRIVAAFYRGAFEAKRQVAVLDTTRLGADPAALARRLPVLVAPALYVAGDELLDFLARYAEAGGHLVLTFRSGYADREARPRPLVMPGLLRQPVGAHYLEYTDLAQPVAVRGHGEAGGAGGAGLAGSATGWADCLVPDSAVTLASYQHPHLGRWSAVTTNQHGAGRVTYVGTLPDAVLARAVMRWVADTSLAPEPWAESPPSVTVTGARAGDGRHLTFASNWSWEPAAFPVPVPVDDLLSGERLDPGQHLTLRPWDVRVLADRDHQDNDATPPIRSQEGGPGE